MDWWVVFVPLTFVVIAMLVSGGGSKAMSREQRARIDAIERKLDLIMDSLGIAEPEPASPPGVLEELAAGRKIQAIKAYRQATGAGLREAKDAVEAIARSRGLPG